MDLGKEALKKILGATRNCKRWSDIEAVKLTEIILGRAMLEKILSINVLELVVTLLDCRNFLFLIFIFYVPKISNKF